jgi:hypothetical protein
MSSLESDRNTCGCGHHADEHTLEVCLVYRDPLEPDESGQSFQWQMRCSGLVLSEDDPTVSLPCRCIDFSNRFDGLGSEHSEDCY